VTHADAPAPAVLPERVPTPDASALAVALNEAGVACAVEGRERLALLVVDPGAAAAFAEAPARERVLRLAAAHGFTHLAVELREGDGAEPREATEGPAAARAPLRRA
jgi:hypothetical protein